LGIELGVQEVEPLDLPTRLHEKCAILASSDRQNVPDKSRRSRGISLAVVSAIGFGYFSHQMVS
jgi:hypothetical protein